MGQVAVTVNGRTYRLRCGEGEEERLMALAAHVRSRLETLVAEFGQAGDERLMLVAALLVTDELFDARDRIRQLEIELEAAATDVGTAADKPGTSKAGAA